MKKEQPPLRKKQHGMCHTTTYSAWADMIQRCTNPNTTGYENYGGRGIKVHESWLDFRNFYADMGAKPEGMTLDRTDVNGNYEPGNCRYVSYVVQATNKRTSKLNKNGIEGVWYDEKKARWIVKIGLHNWNRHIGTYDDFFEACCARLSAVNFFRNELWS